MKDPLDEAILILLYMPGHMTKLTVVLFFFKKNLWN